MQQPEIELSRLDETGEIIATIIEKVRMISFHESGCPSAVYTKYQELFASDGCDQFTNLEGTIIGKLCTQKND